ncbi:hypothetical protein DY000_02004112 [Brassica cretica]|uniref:Uncharacterized protein n=1 Tax=Brassica cretica TaxID=69181 RepID=A0ABQ7CEJ9_BRACR|nr:hypothetical protein DY000_02004112 [Brassica cretica]
MLSREIEKSKRRNERDERERRKREEEKMSSMPTRVSQDTLALTPMFCDLPSEIIRLWFPVESDDRSLCLDRWRSLKPEKMVENRIPDLAPVGHGGMCFWKR